MMINNELLPCGNLVLKTLAMPEHKNANGHIFGGWIMSQVDLAGGILAKEIAKGSIVTACVNHLNFLKPVLVGDIVYCYASCLKTGKSAITIALEVWIKRLAENGFASKQKVTNAELVYVAVNEDFRPHSLPLLAQDFDCTVHPTTQLNIDLA